jgi:hypothetical protein
MSRIERTSLDTIVRVALTKESRKHRVGFVSPWYRERTYSSECHRADLRSCYALSMELLSQEDVERIC